MTNIKTSIRVLVVDCNVDAAEILGILLGAYGFETKVECGKAAALRAAELFRPHALLIDLGSNNMDTYEMAAAIRVNPKFHDVFLITISDSNSLKPILKNDHVRIDVQLTKPAAYRMLIDTLNHHFDT
jgi:CheY-like chemotaxis protein